MGKNYSHKQRKRFLEKKGEIMEKVDPQLTDSGNYRMNSLFMEMNKIPKVRENTKGRNVPENPSNTMTIRERKHQYGKEMPRPHTMENGDKVMLIPCPMKKAEGYGNAQSSVKGKTIHKTVKSRYGYVKRIKEKPLMTKIWGSHDYGKSGK